MESGEVGLSKNIGSYARSLLIDRRTVVLLNLYFRGEQDYLLDIARQTNTTYSRCTSICAKFRDMGLIEYRQVGKGKKGRIVALTPLGRLIAEPLYKIVFALSEHEKKTVGRLS